MFKLARDKYMVALESAEELEKTLRKENENLGIISKKLTENWWGIQAEISLRAINKSIEISNHAKALAYTQGMTSIMGEYLPELEKLMAKREQIGQQLKQDGYVEPDLTSFSENELIVNYEYIDDIKADVEGALHYGDTAAEILEEMIEDAEEYGGEYLNLTQVREILKEGKKKLHRLENYKYEFGDFGKKMSDLEYNMSLDLSNVMRAQGDTTLIKNPMLVIGIKNALRIGKMGKDNQETVMEQEEETTKFSVEVSKEMLIACGWSEEIVTDEMIEELNIVLEKYEINTPERIKHFLAQCSYESYYGCKTVEIGSEEYFSKKAYGSKYRGVGYIQMTWEYAYQAFATYLILEEYPELKEFASYKNPACNGKEIIAQEYKKITEKANEMGLDIEKYTQIVDQGYLYVSDNFSWECAGYYWEISGLNEVVDNGGTVEDVSRVVNKWDEDSFSERRDIYEKIDEIIIFD